MNKIHEVFPLIVYQGSIENHLEFKEKNLDSLRSYWFNGYENESPEASGRIFAHLNSEYFDLFSELKRNIDNYFTHLEIDYSKLKYHITKSWVGYHADDKTPSVKPHTHNESNLSFVYYLKTDETSDKLCVAQKENRNECFEGIFHTSDKDDKNLIKKYNRYNCNFYTITPYEGTVLIFPSDLGHFTQKFTTRDGERVVIAGDVRVTLTKETSDHYQGSTHPSQWMEL